MYTIGVKDLISVKEAAELTGYSVDYVYDLAQQGKIDAQKVGWGWVIDREGILKYMREMEQDPRGGPRPKN